MTDEEIRTLQALRGFLSGGAPIDGRWFGETHPKRIGNFWWRSDLRLIDRAIYDLAAARAELATVKAALVDNNDLLRSALQIAKREGVDGEIASTNWDAYYNRVAVVLKRHHETANAARAALQSTPAQKEQSDE